MKKTIAIIALLVCHCAPGRTVYYYPAPIDNVVTCCGATKYDKNNHYVIFSRVVPPLQTKDEGCIKPENLFYRVTKYPDKNISVSVVCKKLASYVELKEEKMERGE